MLGKLKKTSRGFERIEFKDYDGVNCSLQQSSLATDDALWLGCDTHPSLHLGRTVSPRMHLSRDQVVALAGQLQLWLKSGKFK